MFTNLDKCEKDDLAETSDNPFSYVARYLKETIYAYLEIGLWQRLSTTYRYLSSFKE